MYFTDYDRILESYYHYITINGMVLTYYGDDQKPTFMNDVRLLMNNGAVKLTEDVCKENHGTIYYQLMSEKLSLSGIYKKEVA